MRDSYRQRLYSAERSLPECSQPRMTLEAMEAYLAKIQDDAWYKRHFRPSRGKITHRPVSWGQRRGLAFTWSNQISMPVWARTKMLVLHEVAHIVVRRTPWYDQFPSGHGFAAHGWQFCQTYLALVRHFLGADVEARLKAAMKERKVPYRTPRAKRTLTPEQRAVLVERMAHARAAKAMAH